MAQGHIICNLFDHCWQQHQDNPGVHLYEHDHQEPEHFFFTVELASIKIMPEQVNMKLWDHSSIPVNASHVLMAQPMLPAGDYQSLASMNSLGMPHVPIKEYSEAYPHDAYTLGYSSPPSHD